MNYKYLPQVGQQVSELCLGTMMFGGQTNEADSLTIMDYAFANGINYFDTADTYNGGETEKIVAKGLKGRRSKIILSTKVCHAVGDSFNGEGLSRRYILSALDNSLKRLETDYIDIYYMHSPDYHTNIEETMDTMSAIVRSGKVLNIGVSNFAAWQIADLLAVCDKRGYVAPVITQNVYNAIVRNIEPELVPFVQTHNLGMAVYNPIAAGLLAGKHKPGKPENNTRFANSSLYAGRYWNDDNFAAVEVFKKIAADAGMSILELAYKWCAAHPYVTTILSGVSSLDQLKQNIAAMNGSLPSSDVMAKCDEMYTALLSGTGNRFRYNR